LSSYIVSSTSVIAEFSVPEYGYNEDCFVSFDMISLLLLAIRLHGMSITHPPGLLLEETHVALKLHFFGEVTYFRVNIRDWKRRNKDPIIAASIPTKSPMLNHSINSKDLYKMALAFFL